MTSLKRVCSHESDFDISFQIINERASESNELDRSGKLAFRWLEKERISIQKIERRISVAWNEATKSFTIQDHDWNAYFLFLHKIESGKKRGKSVSLQTAALGL